MAFSLNRAQVIGNLTRDPEVRQTPAGQKVANFGVATNFVWTDQSGVKKERVEFHNIVAWRKLAEICELYAKKGRKIYVEGRLQTRDWEGEDGVKRSRTEIIADNIILLDRAGSTGGSGGAAVVAASENEPENATTTVSQQKGSIKSKTQSKAEGSFAEEEVNLEDLPF